MAKLLDLLYLMFSCVCVTFPCGVLGQVWYLIVSISDLYLLPYFDNPILFSKDLNFYAISIIVIQK